MNIITLIRILCLFLLHLHAAWGNRNPVGIPLLKTMTYLKRQSLLTPRPALWVLGVFSSMLLGISVSALEMEQTIEALPEALHAETEGIHPRYIVARPAVPPEEGKPALLIYLHGGGSVGDDIQDRMNRNPPIKYWNHEKNHPFVIVAPQCLPGYKWGAEALQILLEHLSETVDFDPERVYLTGFSMGGYGTWLWAASSPDSFAAIAPMAGGLGKSGPKDISPDLELWLDKLSAIPTWIFHGGNDTVVTPDRSERMYQGLRERGLKELGLTIYPNAKHVYTHTAYQDPMLYAWMLKHTRRSGVETSPLIPMESNE